VLGHQGHAVFGEERHASTAPEIWVLAGDEPEAGAERPLSGVDSTLVLSFELFPGGHGMP
jgi:hypothetical protein